MRTIRNLDHSQTGQAQFSNPHCFQIMPVFTKDCNFVLYRWKTVGHQFDSIKVGISKQKNSSLINGFVRIWKQKQSRLGRGLLTWPNKENLKWPCNMTENAEDCKRYIFLQGIWPKIRTVNIYEMKGPNKLIETETETSMTMFTVLRSMNQRVYRYTVLRSHSK